MNTPSIKAWGRAAQISAESANYGLHGAGRYTLLNTKNRIDKRLSDLESRSGNAEIILTMEDGSHRTIRLKPGQDTCDLFARCLREPDSPNARMIAGSVEAIEPGGSKLIELTRAILNSPETEQTERETIQ